MAKNRNCGLDTHDQHLLNVACLTLVDAFDTYPYLVGTAATQPDYRDVDVRLILADDKFDHLFAGREALWGLICFTVGHYLRDVTGLPVDFQIQRRTEANEKFDGLRIPLGLPHYYAGGGDATPPNSADHP